MSHYAIGDIQGCRGALERLLERLRFDPSRDRLLLAGDLVSRGEDSLGTLRLLYQLRDSVETVLGNHDLHLLAIAAGTVPLRRKEADLAPILDAPDRDALLGWLQQRPLALHLPRFHSVLVHAGVPPLWTLPQLLSRAAEVEAVLRGPQAQTYFETMYGNEPACFHEGLTGTDRLRVITNYLTRMRFVDADGGLDLTTKGEAAQPPAGFMPWFEHPGRVDPGVRVLFGHWAALEGRTPAHLPITALDTGCVWGGALSALCLETGQFTRCDCSPGA